MSKPRTEAPPRTIRVAIQVTVEVNLDAYEAEYGEGTATSPEDIAALRVAIKGAPALALQDGVLFSSGDIAKVVRQGRY